jgi:hypothetical protein
MLKYPLFFSILNRNFMIFCKRLAQIFFDPDVSAVPQGTFFVSFFSSGDMR